MKIVLYALLSVISLVFALLGHPKGPGIEVSSQAAPLAALALANTAAR